MPGHGNSNCAVGGAAFCLSSLGFFSPNTGQGLARTGEQAARESEPESIQIWLNIPLQWVLSPSVCISQVSSPERDISGIHVPPLLPPQPVGVSTYTQELSCLLGSTRNAFGETSFLGTLQWRTSYLTTEGCKHCRDLDLEGGLARSAPEKEMN